MLCIGWPVAVIEEDDDGTLGEGGVVCRRRDRGRECHESRGQAVFSAGRRCGHGGFASSAPDRFLSPLELDEHGSEPGPCVNRSGTRCSDKGFLPVSVAAYLELLDWTARQTMPGKRGSTPSDVPPILERLKVSATTWWELVSNFGRLFPTVTGHPRIVDTTRSRHGHRRFHLTARVRELSCCPWPGSDCAPIRFASLSLQQNRPWLGANQPASEGAIQGPSADLLRCRCLCQSLT
jgi:hypothetical protein